MCERFHGKRCLSCSAPSPISHPLGSNPVVVIVIQPTAPVPAYGLFCNADQGYVVKCILIATVALFSRQ